MTYKMPLRGSIHRISSEPDRQLFRERTAHYARLGVEFSIFYDPDEYHAPNDEASLFHCDATAPPSFGGFSVA